MAEERTSDDALSRFWNGLVESGASPPGDMDPEQAETVLRLYAMTRAPLPAEARRRVDAAALSVGSKTSPTSGGTPGDQPSRSSQYPAMGRGQWTRVQFATAFLLALTLLVSYVAFGGMRLGRQGERGLTLPAPPSTSPVPASAWDEDRVLAQARIDAIPALASWIGVGRTVLDPGVAFTRGRGDVRGDGPLLLRVESGALTLTADGSMTVTRANETGPREIPPGTDVTLLADDQALTPAGVSTRWRNGGTTPTSILQAGIMTTGLDWQATVAGRSYQELLGEYESLPFHAPVEMTLRLVTLSHDASLAVDAVPGLEMLAVASGNLVAIDATAQGTAAAPFAFDKGTATQGNFRPGRVFRSAAGEPVTLLLLTITPPDGATPPSGA